MIIPRAAHKIGINAFVRALRTTFRYVEPMVGDVATISQQSSTSDALQGLSNFKRYVATGRHKSSVSDAWQRRENIIKKKTQQ